MPPVLKATVTPGPWAEPIPPISVVESCGDMPSLAHEYDIRGEVVFARIGGIILPDVIREFYARFYSDRHWAPALPMIVDWRLVRSVPTQLEIVAMAAILSRIHPPVPARHAFIAKDDAAAAGLRLLFASYSGPVTHAVFTSSEEALRWATATLQ